MILNVSVEIGVMCLPAFMRCSVKQIQIKKSKRTLFCASKKNSLLFLWSPMCLIFLYVKDNLNWSFAKWS